MINSGKCPKCDRTLTYVKIEEIDVKVGFTSQWRGVSYCCPHCNVIINVQIDPIAIKTDIVSELTKQIKRN